MDGIDSLREEQEQKKGEVGKIKELLASPGWEIFQFFVEANIKSLYTQDVGVGLTSINDAFVSANRRSQMKGLRDALDTPKTYLADLQNDLDQIAQDITEAQND